MSPPERLEELEARVRALEARTGTQAVVALVDRADVYHGLRWRAFSLGAALAGAAVFLAAALRPPGPDPRSAVAAVLGAGLVLALAATLAPGFARLFLEPLRAGAEARQRAESLFLERELFRTRGRTAVLLLACRFEREAVVLPDRGFEGRVSGEDWRGVRAAILPPLRAGRAAEALLAGLEALERLLLARGFTGSAGDPNDLPDRPVAGGGA